jgi:hypothetical protein
VGCLVGNWDGEVLEGRGETGTEMWEETYAVVRERSETLLHASTGVEVADDEKQDKAADDDADEDPFYDQRRVAVAGPVVAVDVVVVASGEVGHCLWFLFVVCFSRGGGCTAVC